MFSQAGRPIRSKVSVHIQQFLDEKRDLNYWNKAYEKLFADSNANALHEKSILQQQSFVNI
jgi:hypothetical protein